MKRARFALCGLGAALSLGGAEPSAGRSDADDSAAKQAITKLHAKDQLLQDVGWRLVRGNASFCDKVIPSIGLQIQDMVTFAKPDRMRVTLGLTRDFAVQTASHGSPSALSGDFRPNREIISLEGKDPNEWEAKKRYDWRRLARTHDWIDSVLSDQGYISIRFAGGASAQVAGQPVCATRFEMGADNTKAVADGNRVVIGTRFAGFAYEEPLFAAAIAHELAHNLLGHRAWLDRNKRKRRHVRLTEREADRLMPWLLANAGYDPRSAITFMETWGPKHDGGLLRKRTHDGWDERVEFIAAELPLITDLMEHTANADWSNSFRREIDPNKGA